MKTNCGGWSRWAALGAALAGLVAGQSLLADKMVPGVNVAGTNEDFSVIKNAVLELLRSGDTEGFAKAVSIGADDWKAIYATNNITHDPDALKAFESAPEQARASLKQRAQALLDVAAKLHLDFSKGVTGVRVKAPQWLGSTHYPTLEAPDEEMRYAQEVDIIFAMDGDNTNGLFDIAARGLLKFPGGWRCQEGVEWVSFPPGVADEKTIREMALAARAAEDKGITDEDDPTLKKLGETLAQFVRSGDVSVYLNDALVSEETIWNEVEKQPGGHPSRQDLDEFWRKQQADSAAGASNLLRQLEDAGIAFGHADIAVKKVSIERLNARGPYGAGPGGSGFMVALDVKSDAKSKAGEAISGTYVLAAGEVSRFGEDWRILDNVRWSSLPKGVIDTNVQASVELENYVAEHRALPPGTKAPEIEFTTLDSGRAMKLSDLRGKVVILDFWATWCGPCQAPMAELQKMRRAHADWGNEVMIVPLSIDDTMAIVRDHVNKRGWTNTFNVWAGEGGWHSKTAETFRVTAVPTTYVIDREGVIKDEGYPDENRLGMTVAGLLKASAKN